MVEKAAIGHSKTINEDAEFIVTKRHTSSMSLTTKNYNTESRVLQSP